MIFGVRVRYYNNRFTVAGARSLCEVAQLVLDLHWIQYAYVIAFCYYRMQFLTRTNPLDFADQILILYSNCQRKPGNYRQPMPIIASFQFADKQWSRIAVPRPHVSPGYCILAAAGLNSWSDAPSQCGNLRETVNACWDFRSDYRLDAAAQDTHSM